MPMTRVLALLLAVAVPSTSLAYGPTDEDAPLKVPSQRLLPAEDAPPPPFTAHEAVAPTPIYRHWALWLALSVLTVGALAVAVGAYYASLRNFNPVQTGTGGGGGGTPTPCGGGRPC